LLVIVYVKNGFILLMGNKKWVAFSSGEWAKVSNSKAISYFSRLEFSNMARLLLLLPKTSEV